MSAPSASPVAVAAFYHFAPLASPSAIRDRLIGACRARAVRGTILLAPEGINGTIAGERDSLRAVLAILRGIPGFETLDWKESVAPVMPFARLKVRLKREIVTMGVPDVDPAARVGRYVASEDWNALMERDDVVLIDTRNAYETAIGTFEGAILPDTDSFRDFPAWWADNRERFEGRTVAMFCTGGIRCEKATSWLVGQGVDDVVHLKGGILDYLGTVPETRSRWRGECFVFDQRVAVGHGLAPGSHDVCHACRRPVAPGAIGAPGYERGVSCPDCIDEFSARDRERFRERQRQVDLAARRGERHLAGD